MARTKTRMSKIEDALYALRDKYYWNLFYCDSPSNRSAVKKLIFRDRTYGHLVTIEIKKDPAKNTIIWPKGGSEHFEEVYGYDAFKELRKLLIQDDIDILHMMAKYGVFKKGDKVPA